MRKKILKIVFLCGIMGTFLIAASKKVITIKGSDTMVILAQRWAEKYMEKNPNVTIQVTGGGSGTGISALINGTTDFATASRSMKKSEIDKLKQRYNTLGTEFKVAKDGITIYVHKDNPVEELSLSQIKAIYLGDITNWRNVGGVDAQIIVYGRENNSGTYIYFRDFILNGKDYIVTMQSLPGTAAVVNAVTKDKYGIGYGGAAYAEGVKIVKVKKDDSSPAYPPTVETIKENKYPITRYLYMYSRTKPTGIMKDYIDWILSSEGQKIVSEVGYFPVN